MKIKNEKAIFDLYVEKDTEIRQVLKEPFIQENDGRVWASEGHILIMINRECVTGEYKPKGIGKNIPVREYNTDIPFKVSDLRDALDRCPKEDEVLVTYKKTTCPECDGTGEIEAEYLAEYDGMYYTISGECPICDGSGGINEKVRTPTGRIIPKKDSLIKLGRGYFSWCYIETIIKTCEMLDIKQIRLVRTHETEMSILELSKDIRFSPIIK